MLKLLGSVAQFEREIMLEREREGVQLHRRSPRHLVQFLPGGMARDRCLRQVGHF